MRKKLFILTVLLFAVSCSETKNKESENASVKKSFLENIKTVKAGFESPKEELTLIGKVEYDPDNIINYVPLINGTVVKTYFTLGDRVSRGQTLATVRSTEISSLQADRTSFDSELKVARRELQSAESMYKDNMLSERELVEARAKVRQVEAELGRVKTDMSIVGGNKGGGFSITAPMSGFIIEKSITSGSTLSPDGDPIFTIADLREVWITANVYASNIQMIKEGMSVEMTSLSYPGEVFQGTVRRISQVFDSEEKVLKAYIVMPNPDLKFKPEMSMNIKLQNTVESKKIAIPAKALIFDDDEYFVIVQESKDKFKIKKVELQGHNSDTAYISSGISEGDNVVIKNQLLIYTDLK